MCWTNLLFLLYCLHVPKVTCICNFFHYMDYVLWKMTYISSLYMHSFIPVWLVGLSLNLMWMSLSGQSDLCAANSSEHSPPKTEIRWRWTFVLPRNIWCTAKKNQWFRFRNQVSHSRSHQQPPDQNISDVNRSKTRCSRASRYCSSVISISETSSASVFLPACSEKEQQRVVQRSMGCQWPSTKGTAWRRGRERKAQKGRPLAPSTQDTI